MWEASSLLMLSTSGSSGMEVYLSLTYHQAFGHPEDEDEDGALLDLRQGHSLLPTYTPGKRYLLFGLSYWQHGLNEKRSPHPEHRLWRKCVPGE